ncbi:MAG: metallophosphoesterase family protein [Roseburia sp.]|nr:metallophosphoesterase family protein [Roseburia sp.]
MRYYISDLHFFHENLNHSLDFRGFATVEEMNDYIVEHWNGKVRQGDDVVILGDVSAGNAEQTNEILGRLNGKLYLIKGNHDRFLKHRKFDTSLFKWVKPYEELRDNKRKVILCHYPVFCYNGQYRVDDDGMPKSYMLYGHVHNSLDEVLVNQFIRQTRATKNKSRYVSQPEPIPCNMINCFCMFSDYTPLTLDEWIVVDAKRRAEMEKLP